MLKVRCSYAGVHPLPRVQYLSSNHRSSCVSDGMSLSSSSTVAIHGVSACSAAVQRQRIERAGM